MNKRKNKKEKVIGQKKKNQTNSNHFLCEMQ
jgi:hypothetical protein